MQSQASFLPFRTVAVLGAGVMGAQIAAHLANAGLKVHLLDIPAREEDKNAVVQEALKKTLKMSPNPFASKSACLRIITGNFNDHFARIAEAEWIIEAVVENLAIKQKLMARIEQTAGDKAIISTNTSGLPLQQISDGRSESFKKRFLGTHFFNPPRYLKLLEIIPTPHTDPIILEHLRWFGHIYLGKNIVIAKDTPNFIANRIGTYAVFRAMRAFSEGDYTIEEVDLLSGELIGHPKSATFRTADVVGLDTLLYVGENLYQAIPHDESREVHRPPELLRELVEKGRLGAKTKQGFYKKVKKDILSLNPETFDYQPPQEMNLGDIKKIAGIAHLKERFRALYGDSGRAGQFTRQTTLDILGYAARRVPEITDNPADIDRAMRWGFGWEIGPFEIWDTIGFQRLWGDMKEAGIAVPEWIEEMHQNEAAGFYQRTDGQQHVYIPSQGYLPKDEPPDVIQLPAIKSASRNLLLERKEAALLDLGEGVALYEFRSKANTLGTDVVEGILEALDLLERSDFRGMVIGNDGKNFSVGANLAEAAQVLTEGKIEAINQMARRFQEMILRIRYARKPVVAALQGMALGGACEVAMACAGVVAALETYIGLVELGAGLIPAGGGSTHMTARACEKAESEFPSQIQPFLMRAFETMASARVSTSAFEAMELGLLGPDTRVVMNADRRFYVAREEVIRLANAGYAPPPLRNAILVLGKPAYAAMETAAYQMQQANYATDYDLFLAKKLAYVMSGGDISAPAFVDEEYLFALEREVLLSLLSEQKTRERVESIVKSGKPLRN